MPKLNSKNIVLLVTSGSVYIMSLLLCAIALAEDARIELNDAYQEIRNQKQIVQNVFDNSLDIYQALDPDHPDKDITDALLDWSYDTNQFLKAFNHMLHLHKISSDYFKSANILISWIQEMEATIESNVETINRILVDSEYQPVINDALIKLRDSSRVIMDKCKIFKEEFAQYSLAVTDE